MKGFVIVLLWHVCGTEGYLVNSLTHTSSPYSEFLSELSDFIAVEIVFVAGLKFNTRSLSCEVIF
jgi:hypothetical protein